MGWSVDWTVVQEGLSYDLFLREGAQCRLRLRCTLLAVFPAARPCRVMSVASPSAATFRAGGDSARLPRTAGYTRMSSAASGCGSRS